MCPHRFRQGNIVSKTVGSSLLGTYEPTVVSEVRFLQRPRPVAANHSPVGNVIQTPGDIEEETVAREDVGNIDSVLINDTACGIQWCALEIQAVYFSGRAMRPLFRHIRDFKDNATPFPEDTRRPDYRSSGPKRLMPQLQIRVPTLRRWGKKMAVVVDAGFYRSLGVMETVDDVSNCDIAWFVAEYDESTEPVSLVLPPPRLQTLERAVDGLTGGVPVSLAEFEAKIREKMKR